ncbi:S8 family serine peptidase [Collinsella sp. zg1085]|uniref:S8 family serine peptidase n=1 Tax=Collinsella sp. zg1085 TaxID=2844380 RepID=UPI001C0AB9DD|nr:S8 family serine peptidase [Collinsella sp. zg1085]QWT17578.1 S8 family serine peptidase [Collinsella sp. zg1085]
MHRCLRRMLGVLLLICTIGALGAPRVVLAQSATARWQESKQEKPQKAQQEKSAALPAVIAKAKDDERFSVMVVMTEQLDAPESSPLASHTPEQRLQHVEALMELAKRSQKPVLKYLQTAEQAGSARNITSFYIVNSIAVEASKSVLEQLIKQPGVSHLVLNETMQAEPIDEEPADATNRSANESDASPAELPWNLTSIGITHELMKTYTGDGVVVGIIDSGVDGEHPALSDAWRGAGQTDWQTSWYDPVGNSSKPVDSTGHGTHVAGTILGKRKEMVLGIAPKAKWIAARVFDEEGETSNDRLLAAAQWMLAPLDKEGHPHPELAPRIVNNSWGGASDSEFIRPVLKQWRAAGILPVFSAGNMSAANPAGAGSIGTPASFPESFAVGALRSDDHLAKFSLRGPSKFAAGVKPDISAPGVNILSSIPNGGFAIRTGTSMASPHVAGVAALALSANPDLSVEQLEGVLTRSATPLVDEHYVSVPNFGYGAGKVNAGLAVELARQQKDASVALGFVTGTTYVRGTDAAAPTVSHNPIKVMYTASATELRAEVSDDTGVASVVLELAPADSESWQSKSMDLDEGTRLSGTYIASILPADLTQSHMRYRLRVRDVSGKETLTEPFAIEAKPGVGIGWTEDFETSADGFEMGGNTPLWKWGAPVSPLKAPHSGTQLVAVGLDGKGYKGLQDAIMVTPPIDLTQETRAAQLSFWHWHELDNYQSALFDQGEVWIGEISNEHSDDITWEKAPQRMFKNTQGEWKQELIDLSAYRGKKIRVMFGLRAAAWSPMATSGWFIDDLAIQEAPAERPEAPSKYLDLRADPNGRTILEFSPVDNESISAYALYRAHNNGAFERVLTLPRAKAGKYTVALTDYPLPQLGTYTYYATALVGDVESLPSEIRSRTFTAGSVLTSYNFEGSDQGWTSAPDAKGNVFERGKVTLSDDVIRGQAPSSQQAKGKNADSPTVFGTVLNDYRARKATYTLTSPVVNLAGKTNIRMVYQAWFNTKGRKGFDEWDTYDNDTGHIDVSTDGGATWHTLFELNEASIDNAKARVANAWYLDGVDIPAEYCTANTQVRFVLETGTDNRDANCGGWYIDDVAFIDQADAEEIHPVVPSAASLGLAESAADAGAATQTLPDAYRAAQPTRLASQAGEMAAQDSWIPISARVSAPERNSAVQSTPGSGEYRMMLTAGEHRLSASAPGYITRTDTVSVRAGEEVHHDMYLEKADERAVDVSTVDSAGAPVEAQLSVYKKGTPEPLQRATGSQVKFEALLPGSYIVRADAAGFIAAEQAFEVPDSGAVDALTIKLKASRELKPATEFAHDSGTGDTTLLDAPVGMTAAVKFSAEPGTQLEAVRYLFHAKDNASAEGARFKYAIWSADGADGLPGKLLAGPFDATVKLLPGSAWAEARLPVPVQVEGSYYVTYTQVEEPDSGALYLAVDSKVDGTGASFKYINGAWNDPSELGSFMIRALASVVEEVPAPEPSPDPQPQPNPQPDPNPTPDPVPDPTPGPIPDPTPQPGPEPTPNPNPQPSPNPNPAPNPTPSPMPTPAPEAGAQTDTEKKPSSGADAKADAAAGAGQQGVSAGAKATHTDRLGGGLPRTGDIQLLIVALSACLGTASIGAAALHKRSKGL